MIRRVSSLFALGAALLSAADVPRRSPEFAINMADGRQILLSQYRGKVVAMTFILTTCPHCQKTVGILNKLQGEYGPRGLQVLASAIEDMAKMNLPDFIKRFQPAFPTGYSARDSVIEYLQHPAMLQLYVPQMVFIDRQGTIQAQFGGQDPFFVDDPAKNQSQEKNMRDAIEKLLKEGSPSTRAPRTKTGASTRTAVPASRPASK
jgi:peroxiredoxin